MSDADDPKEQHLRKHGAFHADADAVTDPLFNQSEFFDPRDLVLVKYEMLRRVEADRTLGGGSRAAIRLLPCRVLQNLVGLSASGARRFDSCASWTSPGPQTDPGHCGIHP